MKITVLANLFPERLRAAIDKHDIYWLVGNEHLVRQMARSSQCDMQAVNKAIDALTEATKPAPPTDTPIVDIVVPFCATDAQYLAECLLSLDVQKHVMAIAHVVSDQAEWPELPTFEKLIVRRYETTEQSGPYRIANSLVKFGHMRADWMAIQDGDDMSRPDRLWHQVQILRLTGADMITSATKNFIQGDNPSERIKSVMRMRPVVRPGVIYSSARLGSCVNPTRTMKRSYFESMNGFVPRPCSGDYCFDNRGRYTGAYIIDDQTIVGDRRLHDSSLSHGILPMGSPGRIKEMDDLAIQQIALRKNPTHEFAASMGGLHKSKPLKVLEVQPAYSSNWVATHEKNWTKWLGHLADQPNVNGLEIGVYEGRSSQWWLDNICTHKASHLISVEQSNRYKVNEQWFKDNYQDRVNFVQSSQVKFARTIDDSIMFDFIYLDGSKDAEDILQTSLALWPHLKSGGVMIWDDYTWKENQHRPADGIDRFVSVIEKDLKVIHKEWQFAVCKEIKASL